ncbi:MAG: corrinoid protein [Bacillota bacterium]
MKLLSEIGEKMVEGNVKELITLIDQAKAEGIESQVIINDGLIAAMLCLGEKFKLNEVFIPDVLVAATAMKEAINHLGFDNISDTGAPKGVIVIGTVRHDMHDIGKNLVALLMNSGGFQVYDLGVDVSPDKFVEAVRDYSPDILALSALLTTTLPEMGEVIKALDDAGVRESIRILVGGAPVTEEYAESIGADGYAPDATSAVTKSLEMIER